ncbi:type III toxin-antitoxin system CptIN family toxin [Selenomonas sputigena]|uniref:type III toxin-antitoxin system CptIN family toxin n=1 Tax=Selenomonas sputigena TaxID=69823 RepID=UPI0028ECAC7B|nr:hypothetical protein [Selenomonas sputigena]
MKTSGFYIIKEQFFTDMSDPFLKGNKQGNRPHYYCFQDEREGIYWMIPLSSKVEKFQRIIYKKHQQGKPCDTLHILKLDDSHESVFLLQDMFPVDDSYIERKYTIAGNHLMLTSEHEIKILEKKARKVLKLIRHGVKFLPTQPDVMRIYRILCEKAQR